MIGLPVGAGYSASSSASSQSSQTGGGISVGGINTGVQGLDLQTLLIVAGAAAVLLLLFRRK